MGLHISEVRRGGIVILSLRGRKPSGGPTRTAGIVALAIALTLQPAIGAVGQRRMSGLTQAAACARSHGHLRVGEAAVPGPAARDGLVWRHGRNLSPLSYPLPGKVGFHGCHAAGFTGSQAPPPRELFEFSMHTVNSTGWRPLADYLRSTAAHVIFAQEHRLGPEDVANASAWARRHGWKSVWAPALPGPAGGMAGGTAIFARDCCGLRYPDEGPAVVVEGHAVAAVVEPPGCRPFTGVSAYFHDGQGWGKENLEMAATIGERVRGQGEAKPLYAIAADFNMEPDQLGRARWADRIGGKVVAPSAARRTCRTRTTARTYDLFTWLKSWPR